MKTTYPLPAIRASASDAQRAFIIARSKERAHKSSHRTGQSFDAMQCGLVVDTNPIAYELTARNSESITIRKSKGGVNPLHDATQRAFERRDVGNAPTYQTTVRTLSLRIADKHIRQAKMRCAHLRDEL